MNGNMVRVITAGSVDNGKSTLIGRLLFDSKQISKDQLENIEKAKYRYGNEEINLAFLTDGLKAEREQGITIDVAYRYFSTKKRKYILIDCPGHIQYTKNMITGSSNADIAIILIDGQEGFNNQSKRHAYLSILLGIGHIIFAINKMDLLEYSQDTYLDLVSSINEWLPNESKSEFYFLPVSALKGDNIVEKSGTTPWYSGNSLLDLLDELESNTESENDCFRFPIQWVIRPQSKEFQDHRSYAGAVIRGKAQVGDSIMALPSGLISKIKKIQIGLENFSEINTGLSPSISIDDDLDISRGSILVNPLNPPKTANRLNAIAVNLNPAPLKKEGHYLLKHNSKWFKAIIEDIYSELDLNKLCFEEVSSNLSFNSIGKIKLLLNEDIFFDLYSENRIMGSGILVDESTNETVSALMFI